MSWVASEVVALGNRASIRSRFGLSRIARGLPGLETKHAFGRRARNARAFQRDFRLTPIGPLQRRPPQHQRRPFRHVSVELRDFALRHVMPLAGAFDCGRRRTDAMRDRSNPRRRERKDCRATFAPCEVARPASVRNPARTEAAGSSVRSAEAAIERSGPGRSRYRRRGGDGSGVDYRTGGVDSGGLRCFVACSYAYASLIRRASSHARPKIVMPAGSLSSRV
jgi:hypothetical protein